MWEDTDESRWPVGIHTSVENHMTALSWRIDGTERSGRRLFAIPQFAIHKSPRRIDVWLSPTAVPEPHLQSDGLRSILVNETSEEGKNSPWIEHVLRSLTLWSSRFPDFRQRYLELPFGSRLVIQRLTANPAEVIFEFVQRSEVEASWLSLQQLYVPLDLWPMTTDLSSLSFVKQLCASCCLVSVVNQSALGLMVFKTLTEDIQSMYYELKVLLSIPEHRSIARPQLIVTSATIGGSSQKVCGFLRTYHHRGDLKEALRQDVYKDRELLTWSLQIAYALSLLSTNGIAFCDLRPDNILLVDADTEIEAVLIDFEQRGAWHCWAPPEISYLMCLELGADYDENAETRTKYSSLLKKAFPDYYPRSDLKYDLSAPNMNGYNFAWLALSTEEREKASVFLLGKTLWCMFERSSAINNSLPKQPLHGHQMEAQCVFPEFRRTPETLRTLIRKCTAGAPEWRDLVLPSNVRRGRVFPLPAISSPVDETALLRGAQSEIARSFPWEISASKQFVESLIEGNPVSMNTAFPFIAERPKLVEVIKILEEVQMLYFR